MSSSDRDLMDYASGADPAGSSFSAAPHFQSAAAVNAQNPSATPEEQQAPWDSSSAASIDAHAQDSDVCDVPPVGPSARSNALLGGRFEVVKPVKLGNSQQVQRALDRRKLKFEGIDPFVTLIRIPDYLARDASTLTPLLTTVRRWQGLKHPGVVHMLELLRDEAGSFITAEHLEGRSLAYHLTDINAELLPIESALNIINLLGSTLVMAHARGAAHGAISPACIWLGHTNRPQLLDPGTTELIAAGERHSGDFDVPHGVSERAYVCPEALSVIEASGALQVQNDLYALACIGYELITGQHPFNGLTAAEARMAGSRVQLLAPLTQRQWQAFNDALSLGSTQRRITSVQDFLSRLNGTRIRQMFSGSALLAAMGTGALFAALLMGLGRDHTATEHAIVLPEILPVINVSDAHVEAPSETASEIFTPADAGTDLTFHVRDTNSDLGIGMEEAEALEVDQPTSTADEHAETLLEVASSAEPAAQAEQPEATQKALDSDKPAETGTAERVAELLRRAGQQVAQRHYAEPEGSSAIDSYREVLRISPTNKEAEQGINDLKARIRGEALQAMQVHDYRSAKTLLEIEGTVDPQSEGLQEQLRRLASAEQQTGSVTTASREATLPEDSATTEFEQQAETQAPDYVEQIAEEKL